jgi:hypothetical protein
MMKSRTIDSPLRRQQSSVQIGWIELPEVEPLLAEMAAVVQPKKQKAIYSEAWFEMFDRWDGAVSGLRNIPTGNIPEGCSPRKLPYVVTQNIQWVKP